MLFVPEELLNDVVVIVEVVELGVLLLARWLLSLIDLLDQPRFLVEQPWALLEKLGNLINARNLTEIFPVIIVSLSEEPIHLLHWRRNWRRG